MRKLFVVTHLLLALAIPQAAAGDLRQSAKDADLRYTTPTWTGFYATGALGAAGIELETVELDNRRNASSGPEKVDDVSFVGAVKLGYDHQIGNGIIGLVADYYFGDLAASKTTDFCEPVVMSSELDGLGSVRGKLGFAVGSASIYGTVGVAIASRDETLSCEGEPAQSFEVDQTVTGAAYGGGIEWLVRPDFSLSLEYLHMDLGEETVERLDGGNQFARFETEVDVVTIGASYRFGWR